MTSKTGRPNRPDRAHTIRDVAQRASVSPMTVSNFLNGRFHHMATDTRERIRKAIEDLNYRPRSNARSLRLKKEFSVGMIVVDPSPNFLVEPYIGHVVSGLSSELAASGYACLLQGVGSCSQHERVFSNYARTDALCVFPSGPRRLRRAFIEQLLTLGGPIVAIEEDQTFESSQIAVVRQDDFAGAQEIVGHLLSCGARSFAYLAPAPVWPANAMRLKGIRRALGDFPESTRLTKIPCEFGNYADVQRSLEQWFGAGHHCDAIIGNNDHIGIAALKFLAARGVPVPERFMVTGFGGFELWNYSSPLLTTVISPAYEVGRRAAQVLLSRLRDGRFSQREWVLPVRFRLGESTMPGFSPEVVGADAVAKRVRS